MESPQRRDSNDFDWRDVDVWVLMPLGLTRGRLVALDWPQPSYQVNAAPFWTVDAVATWVAVYARGYWASHPQEAKAKLERNAWICPERCEADRLRIAIEIWVEDAVQRASTRLPVRY